MTEVISSQILRAIPLLIAICLISFPAQAQYGGGSGTAENPYQIYTAEQMNAIGANQDDWDKHFKLMADIDLSSYTGTDFNIIGIDFDSPFAGVFDGNDHTISNFTYTSTDRDNIGLFGYVGWKAEIRDLGLINPNVDAGTVGFETGSLAGWLGQGTISNCYIEGGSVAGDSDVGGLVGCNLGTITNCHSTASVSGSGYVGGLVGQSAWPSSTTNCYSTGSVSGDGDVGGLVGANFDTITNCYASGSVSGSGSMWIPFGTGGLVGENGGTITNCYSIGSVSAGQDGGGLVGLNSWKIRNSFWDIQTSGQLTSAGGTGKTTVQMQMQSTFTDAGWDFVDETANGTEDIWWILEGQDYPRLQPGNKPDEPPDIPNLSGLLAGAGTENEPYLIYTAEQMNLIGRCRQDWDKHFKLMTAIDLSNYTGTDFNIIGIDFDSPFAGVFDGNGHTITNFSYTSTDRDHVGLFGTVGGWWENGHIKDLGLIDPNVDAGSRTDVGSLVGDLSGGTFTGCYAQGGSVSGGWDVGGLAGHNWDGIITNCYSTSSVSGTNMGVGGLVGSNFSGTITNCYSTGSVSSQVSEWSVGGLAGERGAFSEVTDSFWDIETSGQTTSVGGMGKTTAEMQMKSTFTGAGWDFVDETANGTEDIWWILEGQDYPRLWWEDREDRPGEEPNTPQLSDFLTGAGTEDDPYLIYTAEQMNMIGLYEQDWDKYFKLMADIDLGGYTGAGFNIIGYWVGLDSPENRPFRGVFDGNGHTISNFTYTCTDVNCIGIFGYIEDADAEIKDLGLIDPNIDAGTEGWGTGPLAGYLREGTITKCYVEGGRVSGNEEVGGLLGINWECPITNCYSTSIVSGNEDVGGLAGNNNGTITNCYSTGSVSGGEWVGGLVGFNWGTITNCYSTGFVVGAVDAGGLVGYGGGAIASFWDIETSGQQISAGGIGKTTAEMQMASTFVGWSFGPVWTIDEGKDYPRLWWEKEQGELPRTQQLSDFLTGAGTEDNPYLIYTAEELNMIGLFPNDWDKHFKLMVDIDLAGITGTDFNIIGRGPDSAFSGVFDGNGRKISNFTYTSTEALNVGLFGYLKSTAVIKDLGLIDPNVYTGIYEMGGWGVGSLVGLVGDGTIISCYVEGGSVTGGWMVGLLIGYVEQGTVTDCYVEGGSVSGDEDIGGLVGFNQSTITNCYAIAVVDCNSGGGLVGNNWLGEITNCYSAGSISGNEGAGGLTGFNLGTITTCYSAGSVTANEIVGGLVGESWGEIIGSFWDTQTSGQLTSDGGTGKTTAQMQTQSTFTNAGWDFVDETANGTEDIWWILEGQDYPRFAWELIE